VSGRYPVAYRGSERRSRPESGLSTGSMPDPRLALLATPAIRSLLPPALAEELLGPLVVEDAGVFAPILAPLAPDLVIGALGVVAVVAGLELLLKLRATDPVVGMTKGLLEPPPGWDVNCNIGGSAFGPIIGTYPFLLNTCGQVHQETLSGMDTRGAYWYGHPKFATTPTGLYYYYDSEPPPTLPDMAVTRTMVIVAGAGGGGIITQPFYFIPSVLYPREWESTWEAFVQALDPFLLPVNGFGVAPLPLPFSELPYRSLSPFRVEQRQAGPSGGYYPGVGVPIPDIGTGADVDELPWVPSVEGRPGPTLIAQVLATGQIFQSSVPPSGQLPTAAPWGWKDRKNYVRGVGSNKAVQLAGFTTELVDIVQAAWDALPKSDRTPVKRYWYKDSAGKWHSRRPQNDRGVPITHPRPQVMLQDLWNHWRDMDVHKFSDNAASALLIDALFGVPSQLANQAFVGSHSVLGGSGPTHGLGLGPAL
jgi:hypothetical protein